MSLRRQTVPVLTDREHRRTNSSNQLNSSEPKYVNISQESGLGSSHGNISYSPCDPGVSRAPLRPALRPLYFEVPQAGRTEFVGRGWLWAEILRSERHLLIEGAPGTGKTAALLALVQSSCFGSEDVVIEAGDRVVAYHFCQADNSPTCRVSEMVHSLAAQLSQAPHLQSYQHHLHSHPATLALLSPSECAAHPEAALCQGILEPLALLEPRPAGQCLVLVDGLCEAEQHRQDYGHTVASLLLSCLDNFPPWLRLVMTTRTGTLTSLTAANNIHRLSGEATVDRDISDYIYSRCVSQSAFSLVHRAEEENFLDVFASHLVKKASGCFLYVKMMVEFIEGGQIVIKSDSFKLLPQTLSEMYQLAFNIRFSSGHSYEGVRLALSVCLAALKPVSLHQLWQITGCDWSELVSQYNSLSPYLVTRADGTLMFPHPTLRDWLSRRVEGAQHGAQHRFLCNTKQGHAALALHMSRAGTVTSGGEALELAHHLLKSGLYKTDQASSLSHRDLIALHLSLSVADMSEAMLSPLNMFTPSVRVTRLLLLAGADPSVITDQLEVSSLLGLYCHLGYTELVRLLVEWGADLDTVNKDGDSPVCLAAGAGHLQLVSLLVDCGASRDSLGLVRAAARGGQQEVVTWILDTAGTARSHLSTAALVTAARHKHRQLVQTLLQLPHVDIKRRVDGLTPLEAGAQAGDGDIVESLLAGQQAGDCEQALILAAASGHANIVEILLRHGVDRDVRSQEGRTALMVSARSGHEEVMSVLVQEGAGLEISDCEGRTALSHAVITSQPTSARRLVEAGARLEVLDNSEKSLLELSLSHGHLDMLETLLDCGAEVPDCLLEVAMEMDHPAALTLLLQRQTVPAVTARTWARAADSKQFLMILLNKSLEEGNRLFRSNQFKGASEKYKEAIERLPRMINSQGEQEPFGFLRKSLLLNLSRSERRRGELSSAIELAARVIREHPDDSEAFLTRAKAYRAAAMLEEALEDYSSALCIDPTNHTVYLDFLKLREELKFRIRSSKKALSKSYDSIAYIDDNSTNCSSI